MEHIDAGHAHEQLAVELLRAADAARGHIDLARIGLGVGDEFGDGLGREGRVHLHHAERVNDAGDRDDVADEVEIEIVVQRRVPDVRRVISSSVWPSGVGSHDRLGADIAAGAGPVLNDKRLAEALRQPLSHQPRENVGRSAGAEADDPAHRS